MKPLYLVAGIAAVAVAAFAAGTYFYSSQQPAGVTLKSDNTAAADNASQRAAATDNASQNESQGTSANDSVLVRAYSPILGPENAPVTVVEFFDPACEACRAFHPIVKKMLADNPENVRVVLRYAAFHEGSDIAVKILESARKQDKFIPVLEALLDQQPKWASHHNPQIEYAWQAAESAGLDRALAEEQIKNPEMIALLNQEAEDIEKIGVNQTPTFFINGMPLIEFSAAGLQKQIDAGLGKGQ